MSNNRPDLAALTKEDKKALKGMGVHQIRALMEKDSSVETQAERDLKVFMTDTLTFITRAREKRNRRKCNKI